MTPRGYGIVVMKTTDRAAVYGTTWQHQAIEAEAEAEVKQLKARIERDRVRLARLREKLATGSGGKTAKPGRRKVAVEGEPEAAVSGPDGDQFEPANDGHLGETRAL
jgi:hypothetical protein